MIRGVPLDPTGSEVEDWCAILSAGRFADTGSTEPVQTLVAWVRAADHGTALFAALDGPTVCGAATAFPGPGGDAWVRIHVPEQARGRGAGTALADAVTAWARAHGCRTLGGTVVVGGPGDRFATGRGALIRTTMVTITHDLATPAPAVPRPTGVELLSWRGACPADRIEEYLPLRHAVADAPNVDEDMKLTGRDRAWLAAWEQERMAGGNELWVLTAVADGRLIGFTEVEVPLRGAAAQHDTAVLRAYRGRGIGTWLKAEMIDLLRAERPEVNGLSSSTNVENAPMRAVAARLGFREVWRRHLIRTPLTP